MRGVADRAGVNSQLIAYCFGGKESFGDLVVAYLDAGFERPE